MVMNLDSRLLSFPLYVCCNFLYTSPQSDNRPDSSEQESPAHSESWCPFSCCHLSGHQHEDTVRTIHCRFNTNIADIIRVLCNSASCSGKAFCICLFSILAHSESAVHVVHRMTETRHTARKDQATLLPSEQTHYSFELCQELFALRCWAIHQVENLKIFA